MNIVVNGVTKTISTNNLAAALEELGWADTHVATALNGAFVPQTQRDETPINEGDRLEVLSAMQGG
ncbi:MAG TPA: sulfur carrier protein ThiS [Alcanivoracaceae bacterium]|nr:sulfur carrier protein ThiS [Alcanivoracaceae bacterium]